MNTRNRVFIINMYWHSMICINVLVFNYLLVILFREYNLRKNYLTYVAIKDGFEEANCVSCKLLPVCGGGCPKKRIKFDSGGKEFYCGIKEVGIESFLQNYLIER